MSAPKIACIGIIGKNDNLLHMSLFPPYQESRLEFCHLLNACLDVIDIRQKQTSIDQDLGLLHAVDERLASYGWLTNTGVRLVIIIDMIGRTSTSIVEKHGASAVVGLRDSDLKQAFRALQTAYIRLLQDPFYQPDEHIPVVSMALTGGPSCTINSRRFIAEVQRIGDSWNTDFGHA